MSHKSKAAEFIQQDYNLNITGRHVTVTDSLKSYTMEKIARIERFVERIIDMNIVMEVQKLEQRVDIVLKFNNMKIKSHASADNMYTAIDQAVHKLETQLIKYKTRLQDYHAKHHVFHEMDVNVLNIAPASDEGQQTEGGTRDAFSAPKISSKEKRPLRHLTLDEAMVKIDLSGDRFLVFRGEEDKKIKVIYAREDGNYGVIDVEA